MLWRRGLNHWQYEYLWGSPSLTWLMAAGVIAVLTASFAVIWRQLWPITAGTVVMALVRLAGFMLIMLLLLQPSVIRVETSEIAPHTAILLDTSGSMGVVDKDHDKTRLQLAKSALDASKLIQVLGEKSKLSVFEFSSGLSKIKTESIGRIEKATGTSTSLGLPISQVRDTFKGDELAGVVIFSDGRDNTGIDPLTAAKQLKAPIFTVGFGRKKEKEEKVKEQDLAIVAVAHDKRLVVGHKTDVTVSVSSKGFAARSVPVELVLDGQVLATSVVALSPDRPERQVTMTLKAQAPGQFVYVVRVPPDPAEGNKANNEKPVPVFVTDPVARVLYVEARPRWEFKFVSRVLSAYKNVEHTSVVRMGPDRSIIQGSKPAAAARIAPMPPAQLQQLKAVIIGDVPKSFFTPRQIATIAALVEQGSAVMLLGGQDSFGPDGFAGTPLAPMMPAQLLGRASYTERRFGVELTAEGKAHPAFQNVEHDWSKAPDLISLVGVGELKPGATVLMRTSDNQQQPVVIVHRYGRGKVVMVLTDCTWRWKLGMAEGGTNVDLQTIFWRQLISWMMPEQEAEKEKQSVQLIADKLQYELNEQVKLTISALDAEGSPAPRAKVICHIYAPDGKVIEQAASYGKMAGGGEGQAEGFTAAFTTYTSGKYKVVATATADGIDLGRDELSFVVGDTSVEMNETDPNRELLEKIAKASRGQYCKGNYYEPANAGQIARDIVIKTKKNTWQKTEEVWNEWWVFIAIVALACTEWITRRLMQLE